MCTISVTVEGEALEISLSPGDILIRNHYEYAVYTKGGFFLLPKSARRFRPDV